MFKLHIYNPEHDIMLGKNDVSFTPPKAARLTRERFCHIPAFWAEDGDWILVDDVQRAIDNLGKEERTHARVRFVGFDDLKSLTPESMPSKIEPWGWDKHLVHSLLKCNPLFKAIVPDDSILEEIRRLSSREFAAENMLHQIVSRNKDFVGEARTFRGAVEKLGEIVKNNGSIVLKSPWSCSGRGVRFVEKELTESEKGWAKNVLEEQGAIMIEPQYDKVMDFAMEFVAEKEGIRYLGLNIFATKNGAYMQNSDGKEEDKLTEIGRFVETRILTDIQEAIIEILDVHFKGIYEGPFGVDMMIVSDGDNNTKVHPCVEMNLRRTMGQIALI